MEHVTKPYTSGKQSILFFVFSLIAFGYASLLTIAPFSLQPDYILSHQITVYQFRQVLANYTMGYMIGLLVCGILVDITGATLALVAAVLLGIVGNLLFTHSAELTHLLQGRFMVGFGYGMISLGVLKQLNDTFHHKHFAFGLAVIVTISVLMTAFSETALFHIAERVSWSHFLNSFSIIGAVVLVLVLIPLFMSGHRIPSKSISLDEIVYLIKRPTFWLGSIAVYIAWQYIFFLLNRVTVPYLAETLHFSRASIHALMYLSLAVFIIGALLLGYFSEVIGKKRFYISLGFFLMVGVLYLMVAQLVNSYLLMLLLFTIGALGASMVVFIYARLREYCTASTVAFCFGLVLLVYVLLQMFVTPFLISVLSSTALSLTAPNNINSQFVDLLSIIILLMLVGAFFGMGLRAPTKRYHSELTLGKELAQSWRGQAPLGRTYWLLNILGHFYIGLLLFSLKLIVYPSLVNTHGGFYNLYLIDIPFQVFTLICVWRCAYNVKWGNAWTYIARAMVILGFAQLLLSIGLRIYYFL